MSIDLNPMPEFHENNDIAALWALRILLDLNGIIGLNNFSMSEFELLRTFNLCHLESSDLEKSEFRTELLKKKKHLLKRKPELSGELKNNVGLLGKLACLSRVEKQIFAFVILLNNHPGLNMISDSLGSMSNNMLIRSLSVILHLPYTQITHAFSFDSLFASAGIMRLSPGGPSNMVRKIQLGRRLEDMMFEPVNSEQDLMRNFFTLSAPSSLKAKDFDHVKKDFQTISSYLKQSLKQRVRGVNILLYGKPGTGKTELARTLAYTTGMKLQEIISSDEEGHPLNGNERFFSYQLSQHVLGRKQDSIILFDEIEDVFPRDTLSFFGISNTKNQRKAWINKLLEENPVPAIWVSNQIDHIDNAFIRRFDLTLELTTPPVEIREKMMIRQFKHLPVEKSWIRQLAQNSSISPAVISRAEKVVSCLDQTKSSDIETTLQRVIGNNMQAMGEPKPSINNSKDLISYRLDSVNPDHELLPLIQGLKDHPHGRICFYGPSGTGKTQFAHYLAKNLNKSLLIKRASDLLDPYVGMSEKNIAAMFLEAKSLEKILLLDEADSFLRDRRQARNSWETTLVNELLVQMEAFEGIFICSTNLMDELDAASLRRFDLKIQFNYLTSEQAWNLFKQVLKDANATFRNQAAYQRKLSEHTNLTPGDFATIVRQLRFSGKKLTPEILLKGLCLETKFKPVLHKNGIGFSATIT